MSDELTDRQFWDEYWASVPLPATVDQSFSFDRCLVQEMRRQLMGRGITGASVEIGAAPGKWLALLFEMGLNVSAIEYSPVGAEALQTNLGLLGVDLDRLWVGDFFEIEPQEDFDLVLSLGFIEHFGDPAAVLDRHVDWARSGGYILIGVPNFRYIHGHLQRMRDMEVYRAHNTEVMRPEFFSSYSASRGLIVLESQYIGSFEPALPMVGSNPSTSTKGRAARKASGAALRLAALARRSRRFDNLNHPMLSSYLLTLLRKP